MESCARSIFCPPDCRIGEASPSPLRKAPISSGREDVRRFCGRFPCFHWSLVFFFFVCVALEVTAAVPPALIDTPKISANDQSRGCCRNHHNPWCSSGSDRWVHTQLPPHGDAEVHVVPLFFLLRHKPGKEFFVVSPFLFPFFCSHHCANMLV